MPECGVSHGFVPKRKFCFAIIVAFSIATLSAYVIYVHNSSATRPVITASKPVNAAAQPVNTTTKPAKSGTKPVQSARPECDVVPELAQSLPSNCSGASLCIGFHTPFFTWQNWVSQVTAWVSGGQATCGARCEFTANASAADAVIFHDRNLPQEICLRRRAEQRWIYFNMESPLASSHRPRLRFAFNLTATTLATSDIRVVYGAWRRRRRPLPASVRLFEPAKKLHDAFVVFSNCRTPNERLQKVRLLQKFLDVHAFGRCGNRTVQAGWAEKRTLSEAYRFYLSFENAFCRDYITEKFHRNGLSSAAVPVVFGGMSRRDFERVAPPNSFIYAEDFATMRQLAKHLKEVAADEKKYAAFFEWKRHFEPSPRSFPLCRICRALHAAKGTSVADLQKFTDTRTNCRPPNYSYLP